MKNLIALLLILMSTHLYAENRLILNIDQVLINKLHPSQHGIYKKNVYQFKKTESAVYTSLSMSQLFLDQVLKLKFFDRIIITGLRSDSKNKTLMQKFFRDLDSDIFQYEGDDFADFMDDKIRGNDFVVGIADFRYLSKLKENKKQVSILSAVSSFSFLSKAEFESSEGQVSDDEWEKIISSRGWIFYQLLKVINDKTRNEIIAINTDEKYLSNIKLGNSLLAAREGNVTWSWNFEKNKVVGCDSLDVFAEVRSTINDIDICIRHAPVGKLWNGPKKEKCLLFADSKIFIKEQSAEFCGDVPYHRIVSTIPPFIKYVKTFTGIENSSVNSFFRNTNDTFRNMLKDQKYYFLRASLGQYCTDAINEITDQKQTLTSEILSSRLVKVIDFPYPSGVNDQVFYHHTRSSALINFLKNQKGSSQEVFEKEMLYLKESGSHDFWGKLFYIAEDPTSSTMFGPLTVTLTFSKEARVLPFDEVLWNAGLKEVLDRFPKLKSVCDTTPEARNPMWGTTLHLPLFYIIAEDSGADILDYNQRKKWFQLLNSNSIESIKTSY